MNRYIDKTHVSRVDRGVHDGHPALEGGDLEEGQVGETHVVKRYPRQVQ